MENLNLIFPEIFISLSIMFLLVSGVFIKDSSKLTFNLSLFTLLITMIITINETYSVGRVALFNESVVIDYMSSFMKIVTLIGGFLVLVISSNYPNKIYKETHQQSYHSFYLFLLCKYQIFYLTASTHECI